MHATHRRIAATIGATITTGILVTSLTATADATTAGTITEQFRRPVDGRAAVTAHYPTVHLYDNGPDYNQDGVRVLNDALWAPLKGGSRTSARGFGASFLNKGFTYGTMTVKIRRDHGAGFGLAVMRWTTGNDPRGGEIDFGEVTGSDAKSGRISIHHHSNLRRCSGRPLWCPDAAAWTTTTDVTAWTVLSVRMDPGRTTYYVNGRQVGTTTKYPTGPTVAAGYRGRLTIQAKCMAAVCQSGTLRIASVSETR